jgi:hypothetical protein
MRLSLRVLLWFLVFGGLFAWKWEPVVLAAAIVGVRQAVITGRKLRY